MHQYKYQLVYEQIQKRGKGEKGQTDQVFTAFKVSPRHDICQIRCLLMSPTNEERRRAFIVVQNVSGNSHYCDSDSPLYFAMHIVQEGV